MGYYMGDFYAGDPGFFSFLGGAVKKIAGLAGFGGGASAGSIAQQVIKRLPQPIVAAGKTVGSIISKHPVLSAAGAAGAVGVVGGGLARAPSATATPAAAGMAAIRGMRGGGLRRRRRMRVTNPKALRRAIRRAEGFKRMALRVLRFTHPTRAHGRAYFKIKKRKRAA